MSHSHNYDHDHSGHHHHANTDEYAGIHAHLSAEGPLRTNAELDHDPTKTVSLRSSAVGRSNSRWSDARGAVNRELRGVLDGDDADALSSVDEWLASMLAEQVLEPLPRTPVKDGEHWTAKYADRAYKAGLRRAYEYLKKQGYDRPIRREDPAVDPTNDVHKREIRENRWQTYKDYRNAVNAANTDATNSAGDAIRDGVAVTGLLSLVKGRLDAVGQTRTKLVMNTRTVQAVNDAALNSYGMAGVESVGVRVEAETTVVGPNTDRGIFTGTPDDVDPSGIPGRGGGSDSPTDPDRAMTWITASDMNVCPECLLLEGRSWTLSEIRAGNGPRPPQHPNCRCMLLPTSVDTSPETV